MPRPRNKRHHRRGCPGSQAYQKQYITVDPLHSTIQRLYKEREIKLPQVQAIQMSQLSSEMVNFWTDSSGSMERTLRISIYCKGNLHPGLLIILISHKEEKLKPLLKNLKLSHFFWLVSKVTAYCTWTSNCGENTPTSWLMYMLVPRAGLSF